MSLRWRSERKCERWRSGRKCVPPRWRRSCWLCGCLCCRRTRGDKQCQCQAIDLCVPHNSKSPIRVSSRSKSSHQSVEAVFTNTTQLGLKPLREDWVYAHIIRVDRSPSRKYKQSCQRNHYWSWRNPWNSCLSRRVREPVRLFACTDNSTLVLRRYRT